MLNFITFQSGKNDTNMEKLQPTKQNDMVANKSNYKVSKNKHTSDEPMKIKTNKYNGERALEEH